MKVDPNANLPEAAAVMVFQNKKLMSSSTLLFREAWCRRCRSLSPWDSTSQAAPLGVFFGRFSVFFSTCFQMFYFVGSSWSRLPFFSGEIHWCQHWFCDSLPLFLWCFVRDNGFWPSIALGRWSFSGASGHHSGLIFRCMFDSDDLSDAEEDWISEDIWSYALFVWPHRMEENTSSAM